MNRALHLACALAALVTPVFAADWETRPDDTLLDPLTLTQAVAGKTLVFYDGGESAFTEDGKYTWTYGGGGTWYGHYAVNDDSTICVTFVTGVTRCDLYVVNAGRLVLITSDGTRFPIRP